MDERELTMQYVIYRHYGGDEIIVMDKKDEQWVKDAYFHGDSGRDFREYARSETDEPPIIIASIKLE
jgi:hypothetical protein